MRQASKYLAERDAPLLPLDPSAHKLLFKEASEAELEAPQHAENGRLGGGAARHHRLQGGLLLASGCSPLSREAMAPPSLLSRAGMLP